MPDYFSHLIAAEKIYENLDGKSRQLITSEPLFFLGAQGADIFFAYNAKFTKNNLGRTLHKQNAAELFKKLCKGNPSYAAGYATHYALDCMLHPVVYAYESAHRSPLAHQSFENDLGLYISRLYGVRRSILPREKVLACTGAVYDSIKLLQPQVTVTGVERCLKRHFSYTRYLYRIKRQNYKCDFDFPALKDIVQEAVAFGASVVNNVLTKEIDETLFQKEFLQR